MAGQGRWSAIHWVSRELRDLLPQWFGVLFLGAAVSRTLRLSNSAGSISSNKSGFTGPLSLLTSDGPFPANLDSLPKNVTAEIPAELCLARSIEVPARAASQLAAVAALDLARKTPFRPDDVYVALSAPKRQGPLLVATQWVIRREDVDRLAHNLAANGTVLRGVRLIDEQISPSLLADLTRSGAGPGHIWRKANAGLAALAVSSLIVGWLYPAFQAARALPALEERRQQAQDQAVALRAEIEALRTLAGEEADFLAQVIGRQHLATALREMTVALKDDVWLSDLTYSRSGLTLSGETASSAADLLIGLAVARNFENPRLSGPVSRSTTGGERFEIAVDFRGQE